MFDHLLKLHEPFDATVQLYLRQSMGIACFVHAVTTETVSVHPYQSKGLTSYIYTHHVTNYTC